MAQDQVYTPVFIVGSHRSGTTLMGDILDLHPEIGRWYEPYFIFDRNFREAPNDCRSAEDATEEVRAYILEAFEHYQQRRGCKIIVDKSPQNSLKMPFLRKIFPKAKYIHVMRDGRDATLSIHREWLKRDSLVGSQKDALGAIKAMWTFLSRQLLMEHRIAALRFEIGGIRDITAGKGLIHRVSRWDGHPGWGPQFTDWQALFGKVSTLEFNAHQWANCVSSVLEEAPKLDKNSYLEMRYEAFLGAPEEKLEEIFAFLGIPFPEDFMARIPTLMQSNFGKWEQAFSAEEKAQIGPILSPLLNKLKYTRDDGWFEAGQ